MKTLRQLLAVSTLVLAAGIARAAETPATVDFSVFADPGLDALVARALTDNQDLAAAAARVDQARALAGAARADYFPQFAIDGSAARQRTLNNGHRASDYASLPGVASWELDLWGRVRKSVKAARSDAGAALATYDAARLSLAAEVVQTHYTLNATRLEHAIVERSVATRRDARRIIADRSEIGTSSPLDLARADTELATAEAELAAVSQRIDALVHALDVLVGDTTASFETTTETTAPVTLPAPPEIPAGLPSALLVRRPDLAAAQLTMDAASARIGVAKAAFYPTIALTGSAGWESDDFSGFFSGDNRVWSFGPRLYLPLFQGGRNRANLNRAEAAFAEQSARYRQTVLLAFRDVRDALSATRHLADQTAATGRAATAARRAADLSRIRYDAGAVSYLEVVDTERSALDAERALARLRGQRLVAAATLVRALGGGWGQPAGDTLTVAGL